MKVYQPCYYNGEQYDERYEIDSKNIYTEVEDAIKEIEEYQVFNMTPEKYKYKRYNCETYENLVFNVLKDGSEIKIRDFLFTINYSPNYRIQGHAYIKVFELK